MKKSIKISLIGIISFLILYLGSTFIMKDKSEVWCMLTWGDFKPIMISKDTGLSATVTDEFICLGGVFDINRKKTNTIMEYKEYPSSQLLPTGGLD